MTAAASSCLGKQGFCQCSIVVQKPLVSLLSNLICGLQSALFHPDPISKMAEKMHKLKCRFQICMPSVVKALGVRCSCAAESLTNCMLRGLEMLLHGHVKAWLAIAHFEQICDEGWHRGIPFHIIKSVTFLDHQQLVAMHVESVRVWDGNSLILSRQRTKNNYSDLHQAHNFFALQISPEV